MKLLIDSTLAIEPLEEKHLSQLVELVNDNRLYLREWLTWLDFMKTPEDFKRFVQGAEKNNASGREFSAVILQNGRLVGRIGLYQLDRMNKIGTIGYWVGEDAQGKGIITKACEEILKHGFETLDLNRIEIRCGTGNSRSLAVPKRLGFQREGIVRQGEFLNGRFIDLYLYSMLKEEWTEICAKAEA
jgi:ribosomal-protein-serine acetyltransferase